MNLDIFNDDAFSLQSLTAAIQDTEHQPGRLGEMGIFQEEGVSTLTVSLEKKGETLSLVAAKPRGSSGQQPDRDRRTLIPFNLVHLPQNDNVWADEVQGVRSFGSETGLETVQNIVNGRLARMRTNLDLTIEWQRIGAIKGKVLDSDGTTELVDILGQFGVAQSTYDLVLGTAGTDVRIKLLGLKRAIEAKLGALPYKEIRVLCGKDYFDALIGHANVKTIYDRWQDGAALRDDSRDGFTMVGNIVFEEYRGNVGSQAYIADNEAYAFPLGVPGLFLTRYGPADYVETVNTMGLPYYARQERMRMDKGIELEAQTNTLNICTRPAVPHKLSLA